MRNDGRLRIIVTLILVCGISAALAGCGKDPARDPNPKGAEPKVAQNANPEKNLPKQQPVAPQTPAAKPPVEVEEIIIKEPPPDAAPKLSIKPGENPKTPEPAAKDDSKPDFGVKVFSPPLDPVAAKKDPKKDPKKEPKNDGSKNTPKFEFKEPAEVNGKSYDQWVSLIRKSDDPVTREEAMKQVINFGPEKSLQALPDIVTQLERHKKIPIDLAVRVNGITAISTIYKMLPLIKKEPDPKLHDRVYDLYKMFLKDQQVIMRLRTVQGLPYLGFKARGLLTEVAELTHNPTTWEVRKESLQTLTILARDEKGAASPKALTELRRASQHKNENSYIVRQTAIQGLAVLIGSKVPPQAYSKVPPEVYKALEDPAPEVRFTALSLISTLSKDLAAADRPTAIKHLDEHLKHEKNHILLVWTHATAMAATKKVNKLHMDPVLKFLNDKDPAVRVQALTVIGLGGKDSKPFALPVLLPEVERWMGEKDKKSADWPDASVAAATLTCIVQIGAETESTPILEKIENDKKMPEFLRLAVGKALDAFADLKHMEEARKKDKEKLKDNDKQKDKKTPDSK